MGVDCALARDRFRYRRLTSLAVLILALAWTGTVVSQEECTGGIEGIEASGVCCILACQTCGGEGCGNLEGTSDEECCVKTIINASESCAQRGAAPCVIDISPTVVPTTSLPVGAPQPYQPIVLPTFSITEAPLNATSDPISQPTTTPIPFPSPFPSPTLSSMTAVSLSPTVTPVFTLPSTPVPSGEPTRSPTPVPSETPTPLPTRSPTRSPIPPPTPPPTISPTPPTSTPIPTPTPPQEPSSPNQQTPPPTTFLPSSVPPTSPSIPTPVPSVLQLPTPSPTTSLPTTFPPSSAPTVVQPRQSDSKCSNGFPGYENSIVCCPVDCGQCGGSGCENILETAELQWQCCSDLVIIQGESCEETGEAPCFFDEGVSSAITTRVRGGLVGSVTLATVVATRVWWLGP